MPVTCALTLAGAIDLDTRQARGRNGKPTLWHEGCG